MSVIIPTYKRSEFLQRAIDSVLNQTYPNIEVIVVDDNNPGSEFRLKTEQVMKQYLILDNVIYIKNNKNLGGALARNQGIYRANGDYITFLDDDDVYLPKKINTQVRYMIQNKMDMSFTDVRIHDMNDELIDYRKHEYIKSFENTVLLKQHLMHHLTPTASYMFKSEAINEIGGFDDVKVGQEFMLMLKMIRSGMKIGYIPVAHVIQYIHDGERISVGKSKIEGEKELFKLKKEYFKILGFRERQYIKFRHHVVMMIAGKRGKMFDVAAKHFVKAVFSSPLDCILETVKHIKKVKKYKCLE